MPAGWKERTRERVKQMKSGDRYKLNVGPNCFRILPNKDPKEPPYAEIMIHRDVGPDQSFVRCGKDPLGKGKCWLCDTQIPALIEKGKRKLAGSLQAGNQFVFQVSEVNPDKGTFSKAKPWWVSTGGAKSLSAVILSLLSSPKRDYEDPKKGYNISIQRTGTGKTDTRYGPPEPDTDTTSVPKSILESIKEFEEVLPQYSVKTQKETFYGQKEEDEEEGEEEETPEDDGAEDSDAEEEADEGDDEEQEDGDEEGEEEEESDDSEDEDEEEGSDEEESEEEEEDEKPKKQPTPPLSKKGSKKPSTKRKK